MQPPPRIGRVTMQCKPDMSQIKSSPDSAETDQCLIRHAVHLLSVAAQITHNHAKHAEAKE
jgi:hypothetical protein